MDITTLQHLLASQKSPQGLDADEVLAMQALAEQLDRIKLDRVLKRQEERKTEIDKAIESLEKTGLMVRRQKRRKRGRPPIHWKRRLRNKRRYYVEVARPKRAAKLAQQLKTAQGWWEWMCTGWENKKVEVKMTSEQWEEVVWPAIGGCLFVVQRYDKKAAISLDNIYVVHSDTRKCLFDGKEWWLKEQGYAL